tara:strand:- start:135 stop:824 length:690 start_codon:yes stop_codon:yes gene_type:complete
MSITISLKSQNVERDVVIPVEWKDITVKYWGELSTIIKTHYEKASNLSEQEKNHERNIDITENVKLNHAQILKMNADIFSYITGLTKEEVGLIDVSKVSEVIGCINTLTEEYKPQGINSFDLDGETYYFPSEFFKKETYGDYIESTQLEMYISDMKNGRYDILPEQMAILCRRIDEEYDDDVIAEKADKFRGLTMDVIWEFSFFLIQQSVKLMKLSPTFLEKKQQVQEL